MVFLIRLIQIYGVFRGVIIFLQFRFSSHKIEIPSLRHTISIRKNTSDKKVFQQIFLRKDYDIRYKKPIQTIIDAGANIGLAALYYYTKFPEAKIICIEPDEENYKQLCKNVSGYSNIITLKSALWNSLAKVSITNIHAESWLFTVDESINADIPTVTVRSLMKDFSMDIIDILKVDIEGSEKNLFDKGSEDWLPYCRTLVIEIHDNLRPGASKSVFTAIYKHNFEFKLKGENLFFLQVK